MEIVNKFKKVTALMVVGLLMLGLIPARSYAAQEVTSIKQITGGLYHWLILTDSGNVLGIGSNSEGQLGVNSFSGAFYIENPAIAKNLTDVVQISAGYKNSLALKADGTVWAWGDNPAGQLGTGIVGKNLIPTKVIGLDNVKKIIGGGNIFVAIKNDGTVWGSNNSLFSSTIPIKIDSLTDVSDIDIGNGHIVFSKKDGSV